MDQARANVQKALEGARNPAVLSSFGKDSLLLLALVREVRSDFATLWFRTAANLKQVRFARRVIAAWNLNAYSYHPSDVYLLTNNGDHALIQEYSFGNDVLPLAVDLAHNDTCSLAAFPNRTPALHLPFDLILVGYKDSDTHWLKGGTQLFDADYMLGGAKVSAPIRHLTDEQVRAAIVALDIPYEELDDRLSLCTACMTQDSDEVWCAEKKGYIPRVQWDQRESLATFRKRFGLNGG